MPALLREPVCAGGGCKGSKGALPKGGRGAFPPIGASCKGGSAWNNGNAGRATKPLTTLNHRLWTKQDCEPEGWDCHRLRADPNAVYNTAQCILQCSPMHSKNWTNCYTCAKIILLQLGPLSHAVQVRLNSTCSTTLGRMAQTHALTPALAPPTPGMAGPPAVPRDTLPGPPLTGSCDFLLAKSLDFSSA